MNFEIREAMWLFSQCRETGVEEKDQKRYKILEKPGLGLSRGIIVINIKNQG